MQNTVTAGEHMNLLIIAGMPASGKTTVSQKFSTALGYPILEKDALKEELFDTVGFENCFISHIAPFLGVSPLLNNSSQYKYFVLKGVRYDRT